MKTTAALILLVLTLLCALLIGAPAAHADFFGSGLNTFDIEFVPIGNADNPDDTTGDPNPAGKVEYAYRMGKYEISEDMIDKANAEGGLGITKDTRGPDKPATDVSWFEAAMFVNWLNTSEGHQAAYNFDGSGNFGLWTSAEAWQAGGENLFRHKDAYYFLPSMDEWYKAAYYDPNTAVYYNYPTGSDSVPDGIDFAGDTTFDAVFFDGGSNPQPNDVTDVGILSPYGTAGQAGNVFEWEETEFDLLNNSSSSARGVRGGYWFGLSNDLLASNRNAFGFPTDEGDKVGFRVASIPEPSTALLGALATGGLLVWRRR